MKQTQSIKTLSAAVGSLALAALISGCASDSSSTQTVTPSASVSGTPSVPAPAVPSDVKLHKDKDIQGVWVAPGFNFTGYEALYVEPTGYTGEVRSNESRERNLATSEVQSRIVTSAQATGLFSKVAAGSPSGAGKSLRLVNEIIKFEKGGGGARFFAGMYGAGQPHIRVRGQIFDGEKLVCVFEVERSGEGAGARLGGGYMGDDNIIVGDIVDLANDLGDFFKRTAGKK